MVRLDRTWDVLLQELYRLYNTITGITGYCTRDSSIASVAMNRVEPNSNSRLICLSGLEQNLSGLEQLPDLG